MSIRTQAPPESPKDPALRLIKQKVRRSQAALLDPVQQSELDDARNTDDVRQQAPKSYAIMSPQPPQHSRSEDARYITRFVDHTQNIGSGRVPPSNTTAADGNVELVPVTTAVAARATAGGAAVPSFRDDQPLDMWLYEVGLDNLGNTCFMNSVLQCLLHVEPLVKFFLKMNIEPHLNLASPKKGALAVAFKQLVNSVYKRSAGTTGGSVSPANIQKAVGTYAPYLMDFSQQDSQEFLRFLLDGMSEDLCRKHSEKFPTSTPQLTAATTAPTSSMKADLRGSHAGILPILPGSVSSPNVADFARTIEIPKDNVLTSASACSSPVPQGHRGGSTASQRLRDETRAMRQEGGLSVRLKSNNQGEEEVSAQNGLIPVKESNSKYVNRLRKQRSESISDGAETPHNAGSADEVQPFSPLLTSTEKASRAGALLRSADDAEDFSCGEDNSPVMSPAKGHDGSLSMASIEEESYSEEVLHRRLPRKVPSATRHVHVDQAAEGTEDMALTSPDNVPGADPAALAAREARIAWGKYLKLNDSIVTDIFAGQLQSTIECLTCHHRSSTYDPFLDLSVPIYRESESSTPSSRTSFLGTLRNTVSGATGGGGSDGNKSTLEKCLEKFTAEEVLDGDNSYTCEKCKAKRKSVKQLSIYKYPQVLVIHIKRFKYNSTRREKLSTDVHFPLAGLDLSPYVSRDLASLLGANEAPAGTASVRKPPLYDLIGVSNHHGSLHSGHYIAHVDTTGGRPDKARRWMCFNDSRVSAANASGIAGPTAYVLFYKLHEQSAV